MLYSNPAPRSLYKPRPQKTISAGALATPFTRAYYDDAACQRGAGRVERLGMGMPREAPLPNYQQGEAYAVGGAPRNPRLKLLQEHPP